MNDKAKIISFRIGEADLSELQRRAEVSGQTPNEFARQALRDTLDEGPNNVARSISVTREEMIELRQDIAVSVEALLLLSGKVSPEEAQIFVRDNLKKRV